jgi:hypothetical protein
LKSHHNAAQERSECRRVSHDFIVILSYQGSVPCRPAHTAVAILPRMLVDLVPYGGTHFLFTTTCDHVWSPFTSLSHVLLFSQVRHPFFSMCAMCTEIKCRHSILIPTPDFRSFPVCALPLPFSRFTCLVLLRSDLRQTLAVCYPSLSPFSGMCTSLLKPRLS